MATGTIVVDARNPAQRRYIYQPYWISSGEISALDLGSAETKVGILFSFPAAKYGSSIILIEKMCFQITEGFAGGVITLELGSYTIATDIPIISEQEMRKAKPDYLFIFPWHFISNFIEREAELRLSGTKFIVPCPKLQIL